MMSIMTNAEKRKTKIIISKHETKSKQQYQITKTSFRFSDFGNQELCPFSHFVFGLNSSLRLTIGGKK
jgi:hypothetical protein